MDPAELKALFDKMAPGYDQQVAGWAPIRDGLLLLVAAAFADLPPDSRLLCVGAGTGAEMAFLAERCPGWTFTAVEPSGAMLAVCRRRAEEQGYAARCRFHEGYLDTLPADRPYDAATCFLVSQFMLEPSARTAFFGAIAGRLRPGGLLASADLAAEPGGEGYEALLPIWLRLMSATGADAEALERTRAAYARDVAILTPGRTAALVAAAGFEPPLNVFQAGLLHAWICRRGEGPAG